MPGALNTDPKDPITVQLGCDPQVNITLTETPQGTLFVVVASADPTMPVGDIDGFFFDLAQDSTLDDLIFFPDANEGSIFSPVTGIQANANSVNTLSNGVQVKDDYDVGIQFGTVDNSTAGEVAQANFTLSSANGPLLLDDLDLDSLATVINSDGGNGVVLTTGDAPGDDPVLVEKEVLFEDFDDLHNLTDSDNILRDGGWDATNDGAQTSGHNDGVLKFAKVDVDGPATFSFEAEVNNLNNFEASGRYADNLELQVRVDGGSWETLDNFVVNHDKSALVGSETGNEITESNATLSYEGGVLDTESDTVQFRFISDISASNEKITIDNVTVETTELVAPGDSDGEATKVDFEGLSSGDVVDDQFAGVSISAQRAGDSDSSENDAMIFDSNNPTGGDHDLEFDGQDNILIISEDNDSDDADDNARGGTITFDFDDPSDVVSINFLDIEERGGTVDLLDDNGDLIRSLDIPTTGDGGSQELAIDTDGVSTMNVNFVGSGAVDDLCYIPPSEECDAQYDAHYADVVPVLPMINPHDLVAENDMPEGDDDLLMV